MIGGKVVRSRLFYGWVIVGFGMLLMASSSTVINSFGVFFKPVAADFGWSRADTSLAQSILLITSGMFSIITGWLADRFGRSKVLVTCGVLIGSGLLLTSQTSALWQIYLTYGLMTGIGLSSTFAVTGTATARWFRERRGLALGITASGVGLGSFLGVPTVARLIEAFGWSRAYLILGTAAFVVMATGAYFLRRNPETIEAHSQGLDSGVERRTQSAERFRVNNTEGATTSLTGVRAGSLWLMFGIFFLFSFSNQMIMVHLVNRATDVGIAPLIAATLVSGIGFSSFSGRILMGGASDRIGNINVLIAACLIAVLGLVLLIPARELWMFYLFTIIFGFAHGAEVPQQTALIGKLFGLQTMFVGIVHCGSCFGGALGSWMGGWVFDVTGSYEVAFLIAIVAIAAALAGTLLLGRMPGLRISRM